MSAKLGATVLLSLVLIVVTALPAQAAGPVFTAVAASVTDHVLTVTFTETGLAGYPGQYVVYRAHAHEELHYHCQNKRGKVVHERSFAGEGYGLLTPSVAGADAWTFSVVVPALSSEPFTCHGGTVVLDRASYSQIAVMDLSNGTDITLAGVYGDPPFTWQ